MPDQSYASPEAIKSLFHAHYHNPILFEMAKGILDVLARYFDKWDAHNQHVDWLRYTATRIINNHESGDYHAELPGMLYWMIYTAFERALQDYAKWLIENHADAIEGILTADDAYLYLNARCESIFVKQDESLKVLPISTVLHLISEVFADPQFSTFLKIFDVDDLVILLSDIEKNTRSAFGPRQKKAIKDFVKARLEDKYGQTFDK